MATVQSFQEKSYLREVLIILTCIAIVYMGTVGHYYIYVASSLHKHIAGPMPILCHQHYSYIYHLCHDGVNHKTACTMSL